jgi:precorrin-6B methylase 2
MSVNKIGDKLAPYNPTNIEAVHVVIKMLNIKESDVVFDLGCGDGRFLIEVCKTFPNIHIQCFGVEYDSELCSRANDLILQQSDMVDRIQIIHDNVVNVNFAATATVLFIYLVPEGILRLKENIIAALNNGARVVTYVFSIPGLTPKEVAVYKQSTKIYLYSMS